MLARERKFGLTVGTAFLVLMGIMIWRGHETPATVAAALGGALIFVGVIAPRLLRPVEWAWMAMAHAISKVTTPLFMGIVYFTIVTLIGILVRLFGRNPIEPHCDGGSYWVSRKHDAVPTGGMERQF
jgi:hypothetical protein